MLLTEIAEKVTYFCRTGELDPALPERLKVYLDHFRNKIKHNLKRAFPLTVHLLEPTQWEEMVHRFLAEEECAAPYFWKVPEAFLHFAKKNHYADRLNIPYLDDLMDFEWLEIEMYMMPDGSKEDERRLISYSYPVFEKKPLPRSMKKGIYFLLAFRHPTSKEIHFISLSPFYCRVIDLLKNEHLTQSEALMKAAQEFKLDP